jgi:hypothetical protein
MDLRKAVKGWGHRYIDPSGVPNAIFLTDLIAYAARRRGLPVEGHEGPAIHPLCLVWDLGPYRGIARLC